MIASTTRPGDLAHHGGRIVLASLFFLGAIDKIADPGGALASISQAGLPWPPLLLVVVIAVELGLGLIVAAGLWVGMARLVAPAAVLLLLYTATVNAVMHPFWAMDGEPARTELSLFFKNVAIMGGLAMVAGARHR